MSVLEVHNVSIRYMTGDFKDIGLKEYVMRRLKGEYHIHEFWADRKISFSLERGDMLGIIGTNGAGKSTLFNAITGAFYVDEGNIILGGEDITFQKEYLRSRVIGHLFQNPLLGTAPHMSIEENMALAYMRVSGKHSPFGKIAGKEKCLGSSLRFLKWGWRTG